jgi:hypothetical protein
MVIAIKPAPLVFLFVISAIGKQAHRQGDETRLITKECDGNQNVTPTRTALSRSIATRRTVTVIRTEPRGNKGEAMPERINKPAPELFESPWWSRLAAITEQRERAAAVMQRERKRERLSLSRKLASLLQAVDGGSVRNILLKLN